MRITAVRWRVDRWAIPGHGAANGRSERAAVLVEVATAGGAHGWGEAAPLEGMSVDSLADAEQAMHMFAARAPFDVEPTMAAIASVAELAAASPAGRFAIETALLNAAATSLGTSVASLLTDAPAVERPCAIVVDDPNAARAAVIAGARCLKIKVGARGDLERVVAIARAAHGVELRIDANRSWPIERVYERLRALADLPVQFIEEPCRDAHLLVKERLPCPIALDESLVALDNAELAAAVKSPGLGALVLKPTLLGGLARCLALASQARAHGVDVVVTHALEGAIGTAACIELALALGGSQDAGLAPHPGLWRGHRGSGGWRRDGDDAAWWPDNLVTTEIARELARAGAADAAEAAAGSAAESAAGSESESAAAVGSAAGSESAAAAALASGSESDSGTRRPTPDARRLHHPITLIATPSHSTIATIHSALTARRPIALLHHRLPPAELARQRTLVESTPVPDETAVVLFTSGSTSSARGVVLSRAAIEAAADASARHLGWRDDDRWLLALSTAHAGGLAVVVRCYLANRPIALLDRDFDRATVVSLLETCTLASLVPTQLAALLDDPSWRPPPRLRAMLLGGAAAPPALLIAAARRGVPFLTTYGLTETFGQVATAPLERTGDPEAPMIALAGATFTGGTRATPAPIHVRGPMLATSYLDGTPIAPELVTSDLGFAESDSLHIIGRSDDVIITGGENVQPSVVEAVLTATPGVRAACVFGIADARWGQLVAAAIEVDRTYDARVAATFWQQSLASHARPRAIAIVDALPLSPNGKLDRRAAAVLTRAAVRYD